MSNQTQMPGATDFSNNLRSHQGCPTCRDHTHLSWLDLANNPGTTPLILFCFQAHHEVGSRSPTVASNIQDSEALQNYLRSSTVNGQELHTTVEVMTDIFTEFARKLVPPSNRASGWIYEDPNNNQFQRVGCASAPSRRTAPQNVSTQGSRAPPSASTPLTRPYQSRLARRGHSHTAPVIHSRTQPHLHRPNLPTTTIPAPVPHQRNQHRRTGTSPTHDQTRRHGDETTRSPTSGMPPPSVPSTLHGDCAPIAIFPASTEDPNLFHYVQGGRVSTRRITVEFESDSDDAISSSSLVGSEAIPPAPRLRPTSLPRLSSTGSTPRQHWRVMAEVGVQSGDQEPSTQNQEPAPNPAVSVGNSSGVVSLTLSHTPDSQPPIYTPTTRILTGFGVPDISDSQPPAYTPTTHILTGFGVNIGGQVYPLLRLGGSRDE
ncbi:hypothetical protein EDD15DRAFT_2373978 [Pisolithus albus]|nr:hypothetical protein EDD15DRAFT_2373978 [Pisolithus albus]